MERAAASIPYLLVLVVPAVGVWRLVRGVRAGTWRRPGWFAHAAWVTLFLAVLVWLSGVFAGGLDAEEACTTRHHQSWDESYRAAHRADWFRLFPLSNKCNAGYDLVAPWVNPAVAVLVVLFLVSVAGLIWTAVSRTRRGS